MSKSKSKQPKKTDHSAIKAFYICAGYCREINDNNHVPSDIANLIKLFCNLGKVFRFDLKGGALKDFIKKQYFQILALVSICACFIYKPRIR